MSLPSDAQASPQPPEREPSLHENWGRLNDQFEEFLADHERIRVGHVEAPPMTGKSELTSLFRSFSNRNIVVVVSSEVEKSILYHREVALAARSDFLVWQAGPRAQCELSAGETLEPRDALVWYMTYTSLDDALRGNGAVDLPIKAVFLCDSSPQQSAAFVGMWLGILSWARRCESDKANFRILSTSTTEVRIWQQRVTRALVGAWLENFEMPRGRVATCNEPINVRGLPDSANLKNFLLTYMYGQLPGGHEGAQKNPGKLLFLGSPNWLYEISRNPCTSELDNAEVLEKDLTLMEIGPATSGSCSHILERISEAQGWVVSPEVQLPLDVNLPGLGSVVIAGRHHFGAFYDEFYDRVIYDEDCCGNSPDEHQRGLLYQAAILGPDAPRIAPTRGLVIQAEPWKYLAAHDLNISRDLAGFIFDIASQVEENKVSWGEMLSGFKREGLLTMAIDETTRRLVLMGCLEADASNRLRPFKIPAYGRAQYIGRWLPRVRYNLAAAYILAGVQYKGVSLSGVARVALVHVAVVLAFGEDAPRALGFDSKMAISLSEDQLMALIKRTAAGAASQRVELGFIWVFLGIWAAASKIISEGEIIDTVPDLVSLGQGLFRVRTELIMAMTEQVEYFCDQMNLAPEPRHAYQRATTAMTMTQVKVIQEELFLSSLMDRFFYGEVNPDDHSEEIITDAVSRMPCEQMPEHQALLSRKAVVYLDTQPVGKDIIYCAISAGMLRQTSTMIDGKSERTFWVPELTWIPKRVVKSWERADIALLDRPQRLIPLRAMDVLAGPRNRLKA